MTQAQLDRCVADSTGESRRLIRRMGFSIVLPLNSGEHRRGPDIAKFLDWDQVDRARYGHLSAF